MVRQAVSAPACCFRGSESFFKLSIATRISCGASSGSPARTGPGLFMKLYYHRMSPFSRDSISLQPPKSAPRLTRQDEHGSTGSANIQNQNVLPPLV